MRRFEDAHARRWVADVAERAGPDFKGRYYLVMYPDDARESGRVALHDVRWNSSKTARRTIETMSDVELRRRLRSARGRGEGRGAGGSPAQDGQSSFVATPSGGREKEAS